ncbi:hypothetical protein N7492_007215 [Penicillium capsulatum]|uniref:Glycosyltransferase family 2 protein n=1 Tax=Penicillium capsulatum TaxID=69766 RepID=A0A9W9LLK8_9EURO|nr:hypothetical protein N7492_007215 [Penicillium capsulatum]KAJ6117053.1 hypothetical protein N7512_006778 [Penicillium capsulatum]
MGNLSNPSRLYLRFTGFIIFCLLLISNLSHGDSSKQNQSYVLSPENGTGFLETRANISIAIATTVLHPPPTLPAWLDYHLRWVQHIVIYMDDPDERSEFERLCEDRPVTLLKGSQVEPKMTPESRLIRRQMANMRHAIVGLMKSGYTWLLHIDVDELLYGPLVESRAWAKDPDVGLVTFTNHEALPVDFETSDPFRDCVFFWVNGIDHNDHFLAYGNGKSAVRLGPVVEPRGAHSFSGHAGRTLRPSGEEAMVLHYPYPSYDSWLRKFNHYGRFSDHWFGDRRAPKIIDFMLYSRDVVQKAQKTGDWANARAFFSRRALDSDSRREAISQGKIRHYTPFAGREIDR